MAPEAPVADKKLTLKSSDGEVFEVEETVAMESQRIRNLIEDDCTADGIPLPKVTGRILAKVIEFCKKHVESAARKPDDGGGDRAVDEELKAWDTDFVKVDRATLCDLILAANYLNIKSLLDLTCQTAAGIIKGNLEEIRKTFNIKNKGKTLEEIRKTFNIKNDFTFFEDEEVRRANQRAKKDKKWRGKSIDLYGDCFEIFDGTKAEGKCQREILPPTTSVSIPSVSHITPTSSPQYEESASSPDVEVRSGSKRHSSRKSTSSKGKRKQSRVDDEDHSMCSALKEVAETLREIGPPPSSHTLIAQCMDIIMAIEELSVDEKVAAAMNLQSNSTTPTIFLKFNHECRLAWIKSVSGKK